MKLKELEKFGFEKQIDHNVIYYLKENIYDDNMEIADLKISEKDRIITTLFMSKENMGYPSFNIEHDDTIYDLIKADLVEKV